MHVQKFQLVIEPQYDSTTRVGWTMYLTSVIATKVLGIIFMYYIHILYVYVIIIMYVCVLMYNITNIKVNGACSYPGSLHWIVKVSSLRGQTKPSTINRLGLEKSNQEKTPI